MLADEWNLFFNGYNYAPVIVARGNKNECAIINKELQEIFDKIYMFTKEMYNEL